MSVKVSTLLDALLSDSVETVSLGKEVNLGTRQRGTGTPPPD